ncbi:hypothetical protein BJY52DRAFT_1319582, partial [Lactarius psammicola]
MGHNTKALVYIIIMCVNFALEPPTTFGLVLKTESSPHRPRAPKSRLIREWLHDTALLPQHPEASPGRQHFTRHHAMQGLFILGTPIAGRIAGFMRFRVVQQPTIR